MFDFSRLNAIAKENKRSNSYLCSLVGKSNAYISDMRRQGRSPSEKDLEIWASALNTTVEYLMGESDKKEKATDIPADSYKAKLLQLAQDLDEEKAAKMLEMAKVMFGETK